MEWAYLMNLGRDQNAYNEMRSWLTAFEKNPSKWKKYYGYQVTMQRYEDIYGDTVRYGKRNN